MCEIGLGKHIRFIQRHYQSLLHQYRNNKNNNNKNNKAPTGKEWEAAVAYLSMPLGLQDIVPYTTAGQRRWVQMWSTYSLWDPSYQNDESFGFFVDVGNGWSTLLPCVVWNATILHPSCMEDYSIVIGFIGTAVYWQILYGTIIYWLSYGWNRRYEGKPSVEVVLFVGLTNGIWFVFPGVALYASYTILATRSVGDVFGRAG
jgi:hypothetical protein